MRHDDQDIGGRQPDPRRPDALVAAVPRVFRQLIVSLDQYIVVVALPDIGRALGYTAHTLQLVVSAYAVASSGFLLVGGRAADLLGQRRMLATGLVLYAVASLAGGLATGPATQLAARVIQGLGGALVFPATLAVVTTTYAEGPERNRALGIWGASGAAGLVVGVLFGGVLTRYLGGSGIGAAVGLALLVRPGHRQPRRGGVAARDCRRHPHGGVRDRCRDRRHAADRARRLPPPPQSRSCNRAGWIGYRPACPRSQGRCDRRTGVGVPPGR